MGLAATFVHKTNDPLIDLKVVVTDSAGKTIGQQRVHLNHQYGRYIGINLLRAGLQISQSLKAPVYD
jgi:hypothetical protein